MSKVNWWMDAGCRWHQGVPPPGWWQAGDGRWRPPAPDDTTEELTVGPPVARGQVPASGRGAKLWQSYRAWPRWARLTGPIAVSILVVGVLGAAATGGLRMGDGETAATARATVTTQAVTSAPPSPDAATTAPTAGATTTTSLVPASTTSLQSDAAATTVAAAPAPPPPTTADPPTNSIDRGAPCSPEGATAVTSDGMSLVCTTQKCHGAPFGEPRWRRAGC
jgi:hypothetical protein